MSSGSASRLKVTIVGSGNWGSVVSRIVGQNTARLDEFATETRMWVFEEEVEGRKLTDIINQDHVNPKYLPGVELPRNVRAVPDVGEAAAGANVLVFVLPHQFLAGTCKQILKHPQGPAPGCVAISLIKGLDITPDGPRLLSKLITAELRMRCSVMLGANIANEIAQEKKAEATIASKNEIDAELFKLLFTTNYFRVDSTTDVAGAETAGALKNVVALAAGFADGLEWGSNAKAALMRIGMLEMIKFTQMFFPDASPMTMFQSCGFADVVVTCTSGRNRKTAAAFVREGKSFEVLEQEMLGGQKLQGTLTCQEVFAALEKRDAIADFPLFATTFEIAFKNLDPNQLTERLWSSRSRL